VVSPEGAFVGANGASTGIGNRTDFELLMHLRSRSDVVLTSGVTARMERYRHPTTADLAVFTRGPKFVPFGGTGNSVVHIPAEVEDYSSAVAYLQAQGYEAIHTEFGATGFSALSVDDKVVALLSSTSPEGIENFCDQRGLIVISQVQIEDLHIARVTQRGKVASAWL